MLLFVFQEGLKTTPEDSCLQLSLQGAKKTSPFAHCVRRGRACPRQLQGRSWCHSAVGWAHCCEQCLAEHRAAAAHRADVVTCSTSALLLVVSAPPYNTGEVWTTLGKWQNFALTPSSVSEWGRILISRAASSSPSSREAVERHNPLLVFNIRHSWIEFTKEGEIQPVTYCSLRDNYTLHTWVLDVMTTEWKIYNSGSNTGPQGYTFLDLYLRCKLITFPQGQGKCLTFGLL